MLAWLDSRINYERVPLSRATGTTFGLTGMRQLLKRLGQPQLAYRVVHVAGTKGKGSTVAMLAAILEESGHRVGRYMSPHVHRVEERIAVDGEPISAADLVAAFEKVIPEVEALDLAARRRTARGPTWFEVMTAAAMVHFADARVDVAVLETGLGGRLDATNVSRPLVTVITSISLDHMRLLGRTIASITAEKAGIIKRGCPIVSGAVQPVARRVIADTATRRRAPLVQLGLDFSVRAAAPATPGDVLRVLPCKVCVGGGMLLAASDGILAALVSFGVRNLPDTSAHACLPLTTPPPQHRFHIECVDRWLMSSTDYSRDPACPCCNAVLELS